MDRAPDGQPATQAPQAMHLEDLPVSGLKMCIRDSLCLGLFLGGQLCLLQVQNGLLRVHAAVHSGGCLLYTSRCV